MAKRSVVGRGVCKVGCLYEVGDCRTLSQGMAVAPVVVVAGVVGIEDSREVGIGEVGKDHWIEEGS